MQNYANAYKCMQVYANECINDNDIDIVNGNDIDYDNVQLLWAAKKCEQK